MEFINGLKNGNEMEDGLDLGEMDVGWVQVHARDRSFRWSRPMGLLDCRPSQLRTGLRAASCYAYNGLRHTVQPHVLRMGRRTWLINLYHFIVVVPPVVGVSLMTYFYIFPPGARGEPEPGGFLSNGGETLARRDYDGTTHCKGLVTCSRPLTFGSEWWHRRLPNKLENSCLVGKVYNLCRVLWTIRIAMSTVKDMLAKPLKVRLWFRFQQTLSNGFGFLSNWELGGYAMW